MTTNSRKAGRLAALRHRHSRNLSSLADVVAKGLCLGLLAAGLTLAPAAAADIASGLAGEKFARGPSFSSGSSDPAIGHPLKRADFEREPASPEARHVADWVVDSGDNGGMPFAIVDKADARVFVFDPTGRLRGAAPALLGLAYGDHTVPGIGNRQLSKILPEERTTPAGRFVAALDRNLHGHEILWVDYDSAISLHPVITTNSRERRAQRLATPTPLDNRISFGCINVPVAFYQNVVSPAFSGTNGIVYVLPETRSAREVFASYDVEENSRRKTAKLAAPPAPLLSPIDR
jgi:hypothetical protein